MGYLCVFGTIFFTVYGQLVLKWQVGKAGSLPTDGAQTIHFLLRLVLNPWVISSLAAGFLAFLCWTMALTKLELSHAYPFTSLAFVAVLVLSAFLLHESLTMPKILGLVLIVLGITIGARG